MNFTSNEVAFLSGASLRRLQWWDERGIIPPNTKQGHLRIYCPKRALQICVIQDLRVAGFSLQKLRKVKKSLEYALSLSGEFAPSWIAAWEGRIRGFAHVGDLVDFLCAEKRPIVVLDLECYRDKIERLAEKLRAKARKAAA